MCNLSKGVEERNCTRSGTGLGTWSGDRNIKCDSEFDGNYEADSRTGDGGIEGAGSGKSEVCRDVERIVIEDNRKGAAVVLELLQQTGKVDIG